MTSEPDPLHERQSCAVTQDGREVVYHFSAAEGITATVDGKPAKFLRLGTGKECLSCGTCVPWFCPACQDEVCNWFETEADKHRTCGTPKPKPVLGSFPALNKGEPVLTCQVELEKP